MYYSNMHFSFFLRKKSHPFQLHKTLQKLSYDNVKTKILTPWGWETHTHTHTSMENWQTARLSLMSTFRKMETIQSQLIGGKKSPLGIKLSYVFLVFHSKLNTPILHRFACVKSRTHKEQSTTGAKQFLNMRVLLIARSVALEKKRKTFKHTHFPPAIIKSGDISTGMQPESSPKN